MRFAFKDIVTVLNFRIARPSQRYLDRHSRRSAYIVETSPPFTSGSSISNQSPPMPESDLVIPRVERSRPVEVDSRTGMNAAHGDQTERWRLQRFATLQSIVQCLGNESAYADASGFCCPAHLLRELVVKRDCGSHDAEHNLSSSMHNTIKHPSPVSVSLTLGRHSERSTGSGRLVLWQSTGKRPMSRTSSQPALISKTNSPIPGSA